MHDTRNIGDLLGKSVVKSIRHRQASGSAASPLVSFTADLRRRSHIYWATITLFEKEIATFTLE